MGTPIEYLCDSIFPEYAIYMHYCKGLKFEDRPDYSYLKRLFTERMQKENMEFDLVYDWVNIDPKKSEINSKIGASKSPAEEGKGIPSTFGPKTGEEEKNENNDQSDKIKEEGKDEEEEEEDEEDEGNDDDQKKEMKKQIEEVFKKLHELGNNKEEEYIGLNLRIVNYHFKINIAQHNF